MTGEATTTDREALAQELYEKGGGIFWRGETSWQDHYLEVADHILASTWLADRDRAAPFDPSECGNCGRCGHCDPQADAEYCRRCGGPNVIWSAASPLWNYVMRSNDINGESRYRDLVCMPCFIICAVEAGLPERGWRLTLVPEPEGLIYETPSGRVWDPERFLWVEPDAVPAQVRDEAVDRG